MNDLGQKIDELSEMFDQEKTEENLREIFNTLNDLMDDSDLTLAEKIVLLINQCIILDTLNFDNIKIHEKIFTRNSIVEQIKIFYEEFVLSSIIDEWENGLNIAFKERISYFISLILYKVHNYIEAYNYFIESRKFSDSLKNTEITGLDLLQQIKRDIFFAYCCEYIGTPQMNSEKLVTSLQVLLGVKQEIKDANEYWHQLKDYCFAHIDNFEKILSLDKSIEDKTLEIIKFLLSYSGDEHCVLKKLIKMHKNGGNVKNEYNEAVHALAHCLNELNMFFSGSDVELERNQSIMSAMENLKKKNLIKMLARIFIDSLGNRYGTCQATIRAEQGNGVDAILRMHDMDSSRLDLSDRAELDFYQYYFESIFPFQNHSKMHEHGKLFHDFCEENYKLNPDNYQDGLLHYYVVLFKNQLKLFLEEFVNSTSKNDDFLKEDKRIYKSGCFRAYEELRKHDFSQFVNIQMIFEREKLITVYKILRNLQNCKLPLFYETENFGKKLVLDEKIEEIYDLCKKFNEYSKNNIETLRKNSKSCYLCEQSENCNNSKKGISDLNLSSAENESQCGIPILVDGLTFEFYGNIKKLKEYFDKYSFTNYRIMQTDDSGKSKINLENKILFFDDSSKCLKCCEELCCNMNDGRIHIFYVGDSDEDFEYKSIAAFKSINICFLMAYIYESIECILDYIFNPKPIYILAPLRNVSNYEFQEAEFDSLLRFPKNYIHPIEVDSGGIGIQYQKEKVEERYFKVDFQNDNIKKACVSLVKLHEDKLYVLRGEKLVHKNVHIGLVNKMYDDYADARKTTENKRHLQCVGKFYNTKACSYFYSLISDEGAFSRRGQEATKKLIHLLYIACEEQVPFIGKCYLLQSSFVKERRLDGKGFEICIFNEDITKFLAKQSCFGNIVTLTKIDIRSKFEEELIHKNLDVGQDEKEGIIKNIDEFILECEKKIQSYKRNKFNKSLQEVIEIKKEAQDLLKQISDGEKVDSKCIESEYINLCEALDEVSN